MDDFIKLLNENLEYEKHEIIEDTLYIYVHSIRATVECPFCGYSTSRCHSRYLKNFQDLPMQGKKTIIILDNRKMFCDNPDCDHTTFAESFSFIEKKSKKTKRLIEEILHLSRSMSSVEAENYLRKNVVKVGRSTICELLKKGV